MSCTSYCVCDRRRHACFNTPIQPEEDVGDSQQSEVDSDEFAGEESD